jgi:hypothetical protein
MIARARGGDYAGLLDSTFGVGLLALESLLAGRFRHCVRLVPELVEVVYGLSLSPGSMSAMEGE